MNASGQKPNNRLFDLSFSVNDYEEENDARDLTDFCKTSKPLITSVQHSLCACKASETTLKQKTIKKLFHNTVKECE